MTLSEELIAKIRATNPKVDVQQVTLPASFLEAIAFRLVELEGE